MFVIYKHTNTLNGKCYVGKTKHDIERRWSDHVASAVKGSLLYFHRAIRKYPLDSWRHEVIEIVESLVEANLCEMKWISTLQSNDPTRGYNMTLGGDGGCTRSAEEIRAQFLGIPKTPEHRQRMRESQERYWSNASEDPRRQNLVNVTQVLR